MKRIVFLFLFSSSLFANFYHYEGSWVGKGKYVSSTSSVICSNYNISISVTNSVLNIFDWNYICRGEETRPSTHSLIIKKGKLINSNNEIIGSIDSDKILIKDPNSLFEVFLKVYETNLFVIESHVDQAQEKFMIGILE